jgi:hypothetical protein
MDLTARSLAPPSAVPSAPPLPVAACGVVQCIGSACENSCCRDWTLEVDREATQRLRARLGGAKAAPLRALAAGGALGKGDVHGSIARRAGGCPFLDGRGVCSSVSRLGPEILSRTSSSFWLASLSLADHRETHGSLACPKLAPSCLFDSAALDLLPHRLRSRPPRPRGARSTAPEPSGGLERRDGLR